ncbi:hypothetical protein [Algibacter mikhailovii]|nr:hypothetical protein [Algibacter mikhailovii]
MKNSVLIKKSTLILIAPLIFLTISACGKKQKSNKNEFNSVYSEKDSIMLESNVIQDSIEFTKYIEMQNIKNDSINKIWEEQELTPIEGFSMELDIEDALLLSNCDSCNESLKAYDIVEFKSLRELILFYHKIYSYTYEEYNNFIKSNKLDGFVSYLGAFGSATYKSNKQKTQKIYEQFNSEETLDISWIENLSFFSKILNPRAFESYDKCLAIKCGYPYITTQKGNGKEFILKIEVSHLPRRYPSKMKLNNIIVSNAKPIGRNALLDGLKVKTVDGFPAQRYEKIEDDNDVLISVTLKGFNELKKTIKSREPRREPVTSNYNYTTFVLPTKHTTGYGTVSVHTGPGLKFEPNQLLGVFIYPSNGIIYPRDLQGKDYRILSAELYSENPPLPFDDSNTPKMHNHRWINHGNNPFNIQISDDKKSIKYDMNKSPFLRLDFLSKHFDNNGWYTFDNGKRYNVKDGFDFKIKGVAEVKEMKCVENCD